MANNTEDVELRENIRLLLQDAMGDFPTEHLLEYHTDNFEALIQQEANRQKAELLDRLEVSVHERVSPGQCVCGFNAYAIDGIMLDYGELLRSHIRMNKHSPQTFEVAIEAERKKLEEKE